MTESLVLKQTNKDIALTPTERVRVVEEIQNGKEISFNLVRAQNNGYLLTDNMKITCYLYIASVEFSTYSIIFQNIHHISSR